MKVLVTGRGRSGSWAIRGEQLGKAIGAEVVPNATSFAGYDAAILVKRPREQQLAAMHARGLPIIWDIVDAWPQPYGNSWGKEHCLSWLRQEIGKVKPAAVVAATQQMAKDLEEFKIPVLALPHHARPGANLNPIRTVVKSIGYEGGEQYIAKWLPFLQQECSARGIRLSVNYGTLADLDVVFALRDQDGYAARNWKSNVKLANAQGTGTPCIVCREKGYEETACGAEVWADTEEEFLSSLRTLTPHSVRYDAHKKLLSATPTLRDVASTYQRWLNGLTF